MRATSGETAGPWSTTLLVPKRLRSSAHTSRSQSIVGSEVRTTMSDPCPRPEASIWRHSSSSDQRSAPASKTLKGIAACVSVAAR